MTRRLLPLIALLLLSTSCTFSDGSPWGRTEFRLELDLHDLGRADEEGRLQTAHDYLIVREEIALELGALSLEILPLGEGAVTSFDPADPPPGYSLCHNGHCHHDDGRLVDYADIEAELNGGASAPTTVIQGVTPEDPLVLNHEPTSLIITDCEDSCDAPRGEAGAVSIEIRSARLRFTVLDTRTGDAARLPPEGLALDLQIRQAISLSAPVNETFDQGHAPLLRLHLNLSVLASLFDQVDYSALASQPTAQQNASAARTFAERLGERSVFNVRISRADL